jgi:excisionase family DNA binding protein
MNRPDIGTRQAAKLLGCSQRTVQRLAKQHHIGYVLAHIRVFRQPLDLDLLRQAVDHNRRRHGT